MNNIDNARSKFSEYKINFQHYQKSDISESDTRSKILDVILKEVLDWDEVDIVREGHTSVGYFDYLISIPGFKFVVEAKKIVIDFSLPQKHNVVTLGTLRKGNKEVIEQVRRYLGEKGLQYGIITNGRQFIISKFYNSDGTDWNNNKALVFDGFEDIEERFIEFYNVLSKGAIIDNGNFLFLNETLGFAKTILSSVANRDSELVRNSLSANLIPVLNEVFGEIYKYEILDNEELIKECFVENEEIKKNKSEIERLFDDIPPNISEVIPARNTKNIASQIKSEINEYPIGLKEIEPPKPIIIIGSKGAGKTTFINYLFKLSSDDELDKQRPYVYLDFRKFTEDDLKNNMNIVYKDILDLLYERYGELGLHTRNVLIRIYYKEIKWNDESIWQWDKINNEESYNNKLNDFLKERLANYENHLNALSEYLIRERRKRLSIIIDNADQFDEQLQEKAFLFGNSLCRKAKCLVIISLREGYYYKWRYKPPFDAFLSNVYHVTAPSYKEILQKRIDFALKNINIEGTTKGTWGPGEAEINNDSVKTFLLSVKSSLFGAENSEMLRFLHETTFPNIREGLEIFKHFLLSGYTNVANYIMRFQSSPASVSTIPIWEFVKATALDNRKYYNHSYSIVYNLFNPIEGNVNHFLKIKLLKFLYANIEKENYSEKYTSLDEIVDVFTKAGYKQIIILKELNDLFQNRLIDTSTSLSDINIKEKNVESHLISISLKGYYYISELKNRFHYLDLIAQDTLIFDEKFHNEIRTNFTPADEKGTRNLEKRVKFVNKFMEYLMDQELKETVESKTIAKNICNEIYVNGLSQDIERISSRSLG